MTFLKIYMLRVAIVGVTLGIAGLSGIAMAEADQNQSLFLVTNAGYSGIAMDELTQDECQNLADHYAGTRGVRSAICAISNH